MGDFMFLLKMMIERGLTLEELLKLAKEGKISAKEEEIKRVFMAEQQKISQTKDERLKLFCKLIERNEGIEIRVSKIIGNYGINNTELRPGVVENIFLNIADENIYELCFLCNRIARERWIKLSGYNKRYFEIKNKKMEENLQDIFGKIESRDIFTKPKTKPMSRNAENEKEVAAQREKAQNPEIAEAIARINRIAEERKTKKNER